MTQDLVSLHLTSDDLAAIDAALETLETLETLEQELSALVPPVAMKETTMTETADQDDDMPSEVDFSAGVRGKFYSPQARFHLPVYLDEAVLAVLVAAAERQGIDVSDLANEMLKRDIENAQALR